MVFYVARGTVIETDGALYEEDRLAPHLRFKRGNIAALQNLLPDPTVELQANIKMQGLQI